jgi:hypothetical protein
VRRTPDALDYLKTVMMRALSALIRAELVLNELMSNFPNLWHTH